MKFCFLTKYKDLRFVLPDPGHMCYICEEDIVFQRCYGWVIYAQCDIPSVQEDEVTIFLDVTLIHKTPQANCVKVMHPEQGTNCNSVWDLDEE